MMEGFEGDKDATGHRGTLGGWIASTLVKLGDLAFSYFPPETPDLQA